MYIYPYKMEPFLEPKPWGGDKLRKFGKKIPQEQKIGESWELSTIPKKESKVANGKHKNISLPQLLEKLELPTQIPFLIKLIDAEENLSVQLHPSDEVARKLNFPQGKIEFWYILESEDGKVYLGTKTEEDLKEIERSLSSGVQPSWEDMMNVFTAKPGDVFVIFPGTLHSLGKGIILAEIQQATDLTFRVYDWTRKDRTLNIKEALMSLKWYPPEYLYLGNFYDLKGQKEIITTKYFKAEIVSNEDVYEGETFYLYNSIIILEGSGKIIVEGVEENFSRGDTFFIPQHCKFQLYFEEKNSKFIMVSI